jgi:hypothetical protein
MGQKVYDLHDPVARANFRVIAIQPDEVELVDVSTPEDGKRFRWKLASEGEGGKWGWTKEELWP